MFYNHLTSGERRGQHSRSQIPSQTLRLLLVRSSSSRQAERLPKALQPNAPRRSGPMRGQYLDRSRPMREWWTLERSPVDDSFQGKLHTTTTSLLLEANRKFMADLRSQREKYFTCCSAPHIWARGWAYCLGRVPTLWITSWECTGAWIVPKFMSCCCCCCWCCVGVLVVVLRS